jgi:hypothetical protein
MVMRIQIMDYRIFWQMVTSISEDTAPSILGRGVQINKFGMWL